MTAARDRAHDPDREMFDREIEWPLPVPEPDREPVHPELTPLDDEEDRRWLR
jgi:hypothetical protein